MQSQGDPGLRFLLDFTAADVHLLGFMGIACTECKGSEGAMGQASKLCSRLTLLQFLPLGPASSLFLCLASVVKWESCKINNPVPSQAAFHHGKRDLATTETGTKSRVSNLTGLCCFSQDRGNVWRLG